jgi:hypothetical protein
MHYYLEGNNNLGHYTISAELSRMDFQVIFEGRMVSDKDEILSVYEKIPMHDLWKVANQSVYSELLAILQKTFVDPELSIRVVSTSSKFFIDFDENQISADSIFEFLTVQDLTFRPAKGQPTDRLKLASIKGCISVDMAKRTASQRVQAPEMCMLFDDELRAASKCILFFNSANSMQNEDDVTETLLQTKQKATALLNNASEVGSKAIDRVVGALGRLAGASNQNHYKLYIRDEDNVGADESAEGGGEDCVSFDDFMNDKVPEKIKTPGKESSSSSSSSSSSRGGWFSSVSESLVGSMGKLLGVEASREQDITPVSKPKNLFVREEDA